MGTPTDLELALAEVTGGFFTQKLAPFGIVAAATWLDAVKDSFDWRAVDRRDSAARAVVDLSESGNAAAHSEMLRLLAEGPPHIRVALVRALSDETEYAVLEAAWKGAQRNFWQGSARIEVWLRRITIALSCIACVAMILLQNIAAQNGNYLKYLSDIAMALVFVVCLVGVTPHLAAWIRFPCRAQWRTEYYRRLTEMIQIEARREQPKCLGLVSEVNAMSELLNGKVNPVGQQLIDASARIRAAAAQRSTFPIPSDPRPQDSTVLPIPADVSSGVA